MYNQTGERKSQLLGKPIGFSVRYEYIAHKVFCECPPADPDPVKLVEMC